MLAINRENREEIENEYMSLLLNKNELFEITQIKSNYLHNRKNQKLFEYCKECYEEHDVINPVKILEKHKDFDTLYFGSILNDTWYYDKAWKEQLKLAEECIVIYYKEDIIKIINDKLVKNEITYDKFMNAMEQLNDIRLVDNTPTLTANEILENINTEKVAINFKRYPRLSKILEFVQGDFLIIGATTGAGKSGLMLNLMNDLKERYQCIYFNMEMSKSTIYKRLISIEAEILIEHVINPQTNYQKENINKALENIEKSKIIIEHRANDIKQIKSVVAKLKEKNRHTILFIDHLGLTKADDKKTLYEQATEVAKQLRQICLELDCTIISASQLNRDAYRTEEIALSMLKDSGELENSASKVVLLYKKNKQDRKSNMIIKIAKNRDGMTGEVEMEYEREKQIFKETTNYGG